MKKMRIALALVVSAFTACFTQAQNVAKVGNTAYATIDEAIAAWTSGSTLTLLADVTLSDVVKINSNESRTLDLSTYTMTAAKNKDAFQYVVKGCTSDVGLSIKADANNPGGITATDKAIIRHTKPWTGAPAKDRPYTQFFGGVFNASYVVYQGGTLGAGYTGASAPRFVFHGGTFNGTIYSNRSKNIFNGGTFNGNLQMSVDSSADALVKGGRFKQLSNLFGSTLNTDKFTIGSAAGVYDRGIYVDKEGYYVITSAPIKEVSAKYPAVKKESYDSNNYFYYSAAATYGMFYEVASMAGTGSNVTLYTPKVSVGENVTVPDGVSGNLAVEEYDVVVPDGVKNVAITVTSVEGTEKVVFNVEPKNAEGTKVSAPASAITFRLPVPAAWAGFAKVSHEGKGMGVYEIKEENGGKYVEVSSDKFSEFAVELAEVELPGDDDKAASDAFGANTVYDGTTYYPTLQKAVEAVCGTAGATLYCKPGADVGSLMHAPVTATLTIYGNGAYVSGGSERDFDIGNTDPSGGKDIIADMTLTVKDLEGCGAWGTKATDHTVNLVFEDCQNMGKVWLNGTTGTLNITMTNCAFEGVIKEAVYSNADGAITLTNVDFSNLTKAINLNHKATGTQTVTLTNCDFVNCGANVKADEIPVRVLSSVDGGKSTLTVSGCTFSGTPEDGADILLDYGVGETTANVSGTAANVTVETAANVGTTTTTTETEDKDFTNVVPTEVSVSTLAELLAALADNTNDLPIVITETIVIPEGETVELDLNGKTVTVPATDTGRHIYALNNKGVLTIKDTKGTGSISARGIYNGYNGSSTDETVAGAKMIVKSGKFVGLDSNGGAAIFNCAELEITAGDFTGGVAAINNRAKGVATINGGTYHGGNNYVLQNNGGTMTINTASVDSGFGAVGCFGGTTTINDGTYLPTGAAGKTCHVVYVADGAKVTITGGAFKMNYPADAVPDSGSAVASYYNGTVEITGGSFTSHFDNVSPVELSAGATIKGGTYLVHSGAASNHVYVKNFVKEGYELKADGQVVAKPVVAKIGEVGYATFAEALSAAAAMTGDVTVEIYEKVTLNSALSGNYSSITFVGKDTDAEIYLDVQGYITATGKTVNFQDLTLSKSQGGFITNAGFMNTAFGVYDVKAVNYTNCTFSNGAYASSGTVTFKSCTFKKSWDKYGLWAYGNANITVDGCTFADYRGIKMYAENGAEASVVKPALTVKNTKFSAVNNKPAIVLTYGQSVTLENNTYSSTGVFELDLDGAPNGVTVTSDVPPTCINDNGACGVLVDGKIYTTVAQAAEVATANSTVTLLHNSAETVEFVYGVTLDKNGFDATGVTIAPPAAKIGDTPYATLSAAFAAVTDDNQTVTILKDVTEELTGAYLRGNITTENDAKKVTIKLTNSDWVYCPYTFVLGANITLNVPYLFYYAGGSQINGTVIAGAYYQRYAGTKLIINEPGSMTVTTEMFYLRYTDGDANAGIYINGDNNDETIGLNLAVAYFYQGMISAKDANLQVGTYWQTNDTDGQGSANLVLDNSSLNVTVNDHNMKATGNSTVTLTNGSSVEVAHGYEGAAVKMDATSSFTKNGNSVFVAKIGDTSYATLSAAVAAAKADDVITFLCDVTQADGVVITDKKLTIDLNGKTFTVSNGASTNNRNFKIDGASEVVISNGTMVAAGDYSSGAYGTVRTEGTAKVELQDLKLYNYRGNGLNVKACAGTSVTMTRVKIYSQYGGGVESAGGTVELTDVVVQQKGMYTAPYNSMAISVNGGGKVTVQSGTYSTECLTAEEANNQGTSHGPWVAGVLNSGGTLIINGGTFSNDNFGENSLATHARGAILADTGANIQINGGTFNVLKAVVDIQNNLGDASKNPSCVLAGGTFSADPRVSASYSSNLITVKDGYLVVENNGVWTVAKPVAKIGDTPYATLEEAFAAATEGQTITLLSDATPALTSQRAITKAAVVDLGGKTLTLTEDDLYFGTTTFKNGTIVVDPSVKPSTAVFWMFANQTLTFDNVKVVATGVTGTYLIGLDGNNSDLNLLNGSEIFVDNTTALDLDIICVNASTGNDIVIDNSKINVTNLDGRVLFRGNYTIKGTSEINLEGITKAGIRIEAGQTLSIEDSAKVIIVGEPRDGGIHLTDVTATYTKADTATVNATLNRPNVATVNGVGYATLAAAAAAAQAGDEIVLLADVAEDVTVPAGVIFNGNGKQVGVITAAGTITFKGVTKATNFGVQYVGTTINIGEGACLEITGTGRLVVGHGCTFNITGTIADAKTADKATLTPSLVVSAGASFTGKDLTFNVTNAYIKFNGNSTSKNSNANGTFNFNVTNSIWEQTGVLAFYVPTGAMDPTFNLNLKDSVLTTTSHLVFSVTKGEIVFDNSNVNVGTSRQLENRSTMTIKNGSVVNGAVATSSNAINPGTIIVENATYAVTGQFSGAAEGTGTLIIKKGATVSVGSIVDKANIQIDATGMSADDEINLTANLSKFTGTVEVINNDKLEASIVDGKIVLSAKPVAKIGETSYATLEDAFKAATEGCTIDILSDVTIDYKWDCRDYATGGSHSQFKESVTINGNGHTLKFTGTVNDSNWNTIFRFEENATVNNLTVDISEATGAQRVISAKKSLTVDGLTIVGSAKYGIIFGEGASATDFAAAEIVVKNSTLTGTRRAISDNEGGKDVKSVVITGNTLNANVYASALESITFNDNTAAGEVDLRSYTAENVLSVEAKGNTLTEGVKNYIYAKNIDAQTGFTTKRPPFKVTTKAELDAAVAAVQDGDVIELLADITTDAVIVIDDDITINGNDKTITSSANRVIRIAADVTINNLNMVSTAVRVGTNDIRGVSVDYYTANDDFDLVLNNCSVDFTDATATDWAYAVNQSGNSSTGNSITIIGGTYKGANVININGTGHTVTIDGANLISTYAYNEQYYGLCVSFNDGASTAEIKNTTFAGTHAKPIKYNGSSVTEENNTDNTARCVAKIGDKYYTSLEAALAAAQARDTITLLADISSSAIIVLDKAITLDGNGKKLTSTAGRAINVSGANGVTIKNLTINASGERAINIIQNATNVTIENVTATAANYTVNVASSAPNAKVAITNSTLNGLCTVNVAAAGAKVTIDNSTVNCNDNNTTAGESYAALCLNKAAIGGSIIAANTTVNVTEGSDSEKGRNGAENGTVTINGSVTGVTVTVAVITYADSDNYHGFTTLAEAIEFAKAGQTITLIRDVTASEIITINKAITLDGNGKKLTSTAGRAINVSGADGVTIKNLTINCSGERAINIIQNATNVTIENVIATAANYTVNVASSAPNAKVAIKNSTLNGLCTVNVSAAGAQVTVQDSTINCNDNNTTAGESYAALSLNKEAVGGSIVATNTTVNVAAGSDSMAGRNGAENGTVTINGSTDDVAVMVAAITYDGSDYYHAFASLKSAIEFAKDGETIKLIRDVTASEIITINKAITLDGNGKTLTSTAGRAINVSGADGVTIKNLTINASGERAINIIQNATNVTIDNVTATAANYTVNVASSAPNAKVAIKNSTLNGLCTVNVSAAGAQVTVQDSTINCNDNNTTAGESYAALSLNKEAVGGSIVATNTTVNVTAGSDSTKGRNSAVNGTVTINGSTDGVAVKVAAITYEGSDYYYTFDSLAAAIEFAKAGDTITLLKNVEISELIKIEKAITLDLGGKSVTASSKKAFEVYADATIKNGSITAANRCVDTRKNVALVMEGLKLTADKYTNYGNPQPLTIGGSDGGTTVAMTDVEINAGDSGYGIITFVKTNLTAKDSTIRGYSALYVKPGSEESTFAFVKSMLSGSTGSNDVEGNSFSAIAIRANTVAVTMDANSTLTATGNFCSALSLGGLYAGEEMVANATVTIAGTIEGDIVSATTLGSNTIKVKAEYADDLLAEGYCASEADANGLVVIMGKTLAQIGDKYYATVEEALAAAQDGTKVTVMSREAAEAFGEKLVATGGKKGAAAYDVTTLLGGSFEKTAEGTLHYDYAFGVSNVAYVGGETPFQVTVAIKDADSTAARTLTGRTLVLRMEVEGETAKEFTFANPVFTAVGDQVTCVVSVALPAAGVGKATYFTVNVTDEK